MELTKSTMKRGKALRGGDSAMSASSDKSGSSFSDSDASGRGRRKDSKRKKAKKTALDGSSKSSGKKKGKDGSLRGSGVKCQFQVHFPCSKKILGPELGVECSASGPCRPCKKRGHWLGECPIDWAKVSSGLPGYSPRGKRYIDDWDGARNPTQATTKAWLDFLKSTKHFPGGGVAALEHGAPSLADFKGWVGRAQT